MPGEYTEELLKDEVLADHSERHACQRLEAGVLECFKLFGRHVWYPGEVVTAQLLA